MIQISKIKQSGAIVIISLLIVITYYIFDQQDLITEIKIPRFQCLRNQLQIHPLLCISCINRKQYQIAHQSNIFIKDKTNKFKVITLPNQNILKCQQILQMVSYQPPIKKVKDIKLQQLEAVQQVIELVGLQSMNEPVSEYQAYLGIQTVAILQLKQSKTQQTTIFTYSLQDSEILVRYYGKILAQSSLLFAIFCIIYYKYHHDQYKFGFIGMVAISIMILGQTMLTNTQYLLCYAISLTIGFYFIKALISRLYAVIVIISSLVIDMFFRSYYSQFLIFVLMFYIVLGRSKGFKRVGTFGIYCLISLIICVGLKSHHWLSLPLRKIIQYTNLTLAPLLMEIVSNASIDPYYNRLPSSSSSSSKNLTQKSRITFPGMSPEPTRVSLPGFQQQFSDDDDDEQQQENN